MSRQGVEEVPGLVGGIAGGGSEPSARITQLPHPPFGARLFDLSGPRSWETIITGLAQEGAA